MIEIMAVHQLNRKQDGWYSALQETKENNKYIADYMSLIFFNLILSLSLIFRDFYGDLLILLFRDWHVRPFFIFFLHRFFLQLFKKNLLRSYLKLLFIFHLFRCFSHWAFSKIVCSIHRSFSKKQLFF